MKPKREKWAKHRVHCACGDALQEALTCIAALVPYVRFAAEVIPYRDNKTSSAADSGDALLVKYGSLSRPIEKGGAPNTQTSLNPGVNKGRRDNRKPKHTTSGTTNLAGPNVSMAPERSRLGLPPVPVRADGKDPMDRETGRSPVAKVESNPSAAMPTGAIPISHAWLDNRCARCGHEHEGPCPFCECAEHVEPVDPYDAEVERALEDAARNPSL